MSGGWHDDPLGRYAKRYHDGSMWTAHVSNGAVTEQDPLGVAPNPMPGAPGQSFAPQPPPPGPASAQGLAVAGDGLPAGVEYASPWLRLGSYFLESILILCTLVIGWLIWATATAGTGQTPAKKILGLRVIGIADRKPVGLGTMFWMRGIIGGFIAGLVSTFTLGIIFFMPFWDRRNQNIWDKISSTSVVTDPNDAWGVSR